MHSPHTSLVPRPKPPCGEEGLVTFECFLGYAHHYVSSLRNAYGVRARMLLGYKHNTCNLIGFRENKNADSAQPRKRSIVTRPLSSWQGTRLMVLACHSLTKRASLARYSREFVKLAVSCTIICKERRWHRRCIQNCINILPPLILGISGSLWKLLPSSSTFNVIFPGSGSSSKSS